MSDNQIQGERTVSAVHIPRKRLSRRHTVLAGCGAAALAVAFIFWVNPGAKKAVEDKTKQGRIEQVVTYTAEKPKVTQAVAKVETPQPPPPPKELREQIQAAIAPKPEKVEPRQWMVSMTPADPPEYMKPVKATEQSKPAVTSVVYKPSTVVGASAGTMPDLNLVLMPGLIRCTLTTAINSDIAGPVMCTLPNDVLSSTGVVLMDKGTKVMGSYSSNVTRGQKRLLTVSATAYTPNGVVVPLGGPMADGLGRAGLEGDVDNHVWERIGGAVLLTLVDTGAALAQSALSKEGSTSISFNSGAGSLARDLLRDTISIPPTITLHQGSEAGLWVTAPIDFSAAYRLVPVR